MKASTGRRRRAAASTHARRGGVGSLLSMMLLVAVTAGACADSDRGSTSVEEARVPAADAGGSGGAVGPSDASRAATRRQIRRAEVDLAVDEPEQVPTAADAAVTLAAELDGVVDGDRRTFGDDARADLVLRVPPEQLETAISKLGTIGRVTASNLSTDDVSDAYTDLETRIANLEASVERVRDLLDDAQDVVAVAAIENELRTRELELETAKGQLRALTGETDLATITLTIRTEAASASESAPAPARALSAGWEAFVATLSWTVAAMLYSLPFVVTLVVTVIGGRAIRRRRPPRRPGAPPAHGVGPFPYSGPFAPPGAFPPPGAAPPPAAPPSASPGAGSPEPSDPY